MLYFNRVSGGFSKNIWEAFLQGAPHAGQKQGNWEESNVPKLGVQPMQLEEKTSKT